MKNKLVFAAGMAVGYVLGTRAGRESYEQLRTKAQELWESPKVQDTVASTTDTLKSKAPEVQDSLKGVLKKGESGSGKGSKGKGGKATGGSAGTGSNSPSGAPVTGTAGTTGPSGGNPRDVEDTPFQAQDSETRPDLGKGLGK